MVSWISKSIVLISRVLALLISVSLLVSLGDLASWRSESLLLAYVFPLVSISVLTPKGFYLLEVFEHVSNLVEIGISFHVDSDDFFIEFKPDLSLLYQFGAHVPILLSFWNSDIWCVRREESDCVFVLVVLLLSPLLEVHDILLQLLDLFLVI